MQANPTLPKNYRYPFSPYPDGWYAVGWSHDVAPGQVVARRYMGRELVLFRTQSGEAVLADAFCPHLGAHLGHVGRVVGDELRCDFHGFCFDAEGTCTRTGYGTKAPPKARLSLYPVQEFAGIILGWFHHEGAAPTWRVPAIDQTGWSRLSTDILHLRTHPQETTENSVDMGHLIEVHKYRDVDITRDLRMDGAHMFVSYAMTRDSFLGGIAPDIRTEFDVMVHGLGYSLVEVEVKGLGFKTRHYVMNTPIDGDMVDVFVAVSTTRNPDFGQINPLLKLVPGRLVQPALQKAIMHAFRGDIAQDFVIWETKKYETRPALARGDGPLPAFRKWAQQFYGPFPGLTHGHAPLMEIA